MDCQKVFNSGWNYKAQPNSVRTKTGIFHYSEPFEVPSLMSDLLNWYNSTRDELHPAVLSAMFQYKFLRIHPFGNGNGRMSRFLGNLILQSGGGMVITNFKSSEREQYLNALTLTDNNFVSMVEALQSEDASDFEPFIEFVAKSLLETLDLVIRGARGEDITEVEDILKQLEIKAKSAKTGYSLQDILNDENLLKEQNKQLEKLGSTVDAYIERVLKHKFWKTEIEKIFYGEADFNDFEDSFEKIKLELQNENLTYFSFYWNFYCKKPVVKEILNKDYFSFTMTIVFEINQVKINFLSKKDNLNNKYEHFNIQFKYLDTEFETKLKDFILKLDAEIDNLIQKAE